jgi:hypothetical protein
MFYNITQDYVAQRVRQALQNYRDAMKNIEDANSFLAGYAVSDLVGLGFNAGDAQDIKTAVADAHQEVVIHSGGGLGSYTANYNFSAAQNRVIGP